MPSNFTQALQTGEYIVSEAKGNKSRAGVTATVAGAVALPSGTVLGKITATGKYVKYDPAASDGSQVAFAVLYTPLPGINRDYPATVHDRDCEVAGAALNGGAGVDVSAVSALATRRIVVRGVPAPVSTSFWADPRPWSDSFIWKE